MIGISDVELAPRGGIRTHLYQFAWEGVLYYDGMEIAMSPIIVNVPGGRTPEILANNVLNAAMKAARDDAYAWQVSQYSGSCTYTFTVLSDREFMMVESMVESMVDTMNCAKEVVFLYRLMGEMKVKPEVV